MEYKTVFIANMKHHKASFIGVFIMIFMVSALLCTILSVWTNSNQYISSEINRHGFGSFTAWVSGVSDREVLTENLSSSTEIEQVVEQRIIYANYTVNEQESDSEGQLIPYAYNDNKYKFFNHELIGYAESPQEIAMGEIYVSPSMISMFDVKIGDEILFPIARSGNDKDKIFTVKGYYENPIMGSSMIGMKGFLIGSADYMEIIATIENSGIDALARVGAMLHIFTESNTAAMPFNMNEVLKELPHLQQYIEFTYSESTITEFMLILQNAFSGFLITFVVILFFAVIVTMVHSLSSAIDGDYVNIGILKTIGFSSQKLCMIQLMQYLICVIAGFFFGLILSIPISNIAVKATLTATGILIPATPVWGLDFFALGVILVPVIVIIRGKTRKIGYITPLSAIVEGAKVKPQGFTHAFKIKKNSLHIRLAVRQVIAVKMKYAGICCVAIMLVFFASLVGRMDLWLGEDGKGMMNAFNPAELDIGVQALGTLTADDMEETILAYTNIVDQYLLAMPDVTVNGTVYTANVITDPNRFHILQGKTCLQENEVVLTEMAANDLGVSIGDVVTIAVGGNNEEFVVSGIYQCANDMGNNIGLNREGYLKIGQDDPHIWCHHYFLEDASQKQSIVEALEGRYGGDVHVHENSWPGLFGIISAMNALVVFMVGMVAVFILIVTIMTGNRLLASEKKELGIYQAIGFSAQQLRLGFALRFAIAAVFGGAIGTLLATLFADSFVSMVMRMAGISNFSSSPGMISILLPALMVVLLFFGFAYISAGKIKKLDLGILVAE